MTDALSEAPAATTTAPATAPAAAPAAAAPAADVTTATTAPAAAADSSLLTDDTPEAKTDTPKTDDKSDGEKRPDDAPKVPEEYADFTLPENVEMDPSVMGEFKALAKENGLTQEAAQKLVALGAGMQTRMVDKLRASVDATAKEWATTAKADAEIGGAKFEENLGVAKKALDTFGTPELKNLLKESRLGSHPEVIRLLARAGKAISQDGFVPGRATAQPKGAADVLYGKTTK